MKDLFSIGEVAEILNISTHTLRYYAKIGLVVPQHINKNSGYRYYSHGQVLYIDRIKYLQSFGIPLDEIKQVLDSNNIRYLKTMLLARQKNIQSEIDELTNTLNEIDWYISYFNHVDCLDDVNLPFKRNEPERYLLVEPLYPGETLFGPAGRRLTREIYDDTFDTSIYRRQCGYLLDYNALIKGDILATHYYTFLREMPNTSKFKTMKIPEGTFFCMQARMLVEPLDTAILQKYFSKKTGTPLVLANEYEDNFRDFEDSIYEIQIQLQ